MIEWRPVKDYEGLYEVSSDGRIRRNDKELRAKVRHGYLTLNLCKGGVQKTAYVHILVCTAFHGPQPFPKAEVAHGDGDELHNDASNLIWKTHQANQQDMFAHGTFPVGDRNGATKIADKVVQVIAQECKTRSRASLAKKYGVSVTPIRRIASGVRQVAHG